MSDDKKVEQNKENKPKNSNDKTIIPSINPTGLIKNSADKNKLKTMIFNIQKNNIKKG